MNTEISKHQSKQWELKIYGVNACKAMGKMRMSDIIRVYITEDNIKKFANILKWCAENRKAYHIVTRDDLDKITESTHHEGVCILGLERQFHEFGIFFNEIKDSTDPACIVLLENITNPHNLGAIIRVCAHFGVKNLIVPSLSQDISTPSSAVYRTAEGGLEYVDIVHTSDPIRALRALKKIGFSVYATSSYGRTSLFSTPISERSVFMFGSEAEGLTQFLLHEATATVNIPGTSMVESLNVACASATVLGEYWRANKMNKSDDKYPASKRENGDNFNADDSSFDSNPS